MRPPASECLSIQTELHSGSPKLYVFFGGIAAGIAMPPFEFYSSAKIIKHNKIFIRDFSQSWYQTGLVGLSHDISSTAELIHNHLMNIGAKKVYFIGNSMGGYGAILFATLLHCRDVVAFAPQTFISPYLRLKHGDFRWQKQMIITYLSSAFKPKIWDLRTLLDRQEEQTPRISIFVSRDNRLDLVHALHLEDVPGVCINEFAGGGHGIVKLLRDEGRLPAIMSAGSD